MVFEEKHHMPWTYEAYEAYEAYEPNFRENVVNAFHRLLLPPPLRLPPSANSFHRCGGPPPSKREVFGLRRSRPAALPSIAYRGFAVAPMTLRAPSRRFLYNPGCRVETLLVSMGVMGFLGDLREDRSRARPVGGSARRSIPSEREQPCCDL